MGADVDALGCDGAMGVGAIGSAITHDRCSRGRDYAGARTRIDAEKSKFATRFAGHRDGQARSRG